MDKHPKSMCINKMIWNFEKLLRITRSILYLKKQSGSASYCIIGCVRIKMNTFRKVLSTIKFDKKANF